MRIITAGDYKFKQTILATMNAAIACGYSCSVYDLGKLGFGITWAVPEFYSNNGYYMKTFGNWKSTAQHKPTMILKTITYHQQPILYLDGDAVLQQQFKLPDDIDIAITARLPGELDAAGLAHRDAMGQSNAGVIYCNYTEATIKFLNLWQQLTVEHDDQFALNKLLNPQHRLLQPWQRFEACNCQVLALPGLLYNNYYFDRPIPDSVYIIHYKNRQFTCK